MALDATLLKQIESLVRPLTAEQRYTVIQTIVSLPTGNGGPPEQDAPPDLLRAEQEAWFAQPSSAREPYKGQYVAVRGGEVVDHDVNQRALVIRVQERWGRYGSLIVHADWDEPPTYTIRGPRLDR